MFDFDVKYCPGDFVRVSGVDALSKLPEIVSFVTEDSSISREVVKAAQQKDPKLIEILELLKNPDKELPVDRKNQFLSLMRFSQLSDDGLLMRYVGPHGKPWEHESMYFWVWLPSSLVDRAITMFHDNSTADHLVIRKRYSRLEERVYWQGMRKDISNYVKSCKKYQESFVPPLPPSIGSSSMPEYPWEVITIDLMGPYPKGTNQNQYLFVIVDSFSKYVEQLPLKKATSSLIIEKLWKVLCRWGVPKIIISDNGTY